MKCIKNSRRIYMENKWISVKDRLPKDKHYTPFFINIQMGKVFENKKDASYRTMAYFNENKQVWVQIEPLNVLIEYKESTVVTHWAEIEPPEE